MVTAGTTLVTLGVIAALAAGFWLLVSPSVPDGDRLLLALEVGVVVLVAGAVAYLLGQIGGRVTERQAGREAAEELKIRHERQEAQIVARQAERAQIAAREAEVIRQLTSNVAEDSSPRT
jgi:Tfp pilus assembly protein PilO